MRKVGEPLNIVICGSRNFHNYAELEKVLDGILAGVNVKHIITGDARGTDEIAHYYGKIKGYNTLKFRANWTKFGRKAGPIRNRQMAEVAHATIAFWDGASPGTKNMLAEARRARHEYIYTHKIE